MKATQKECNHFELTRCTDTEWSCKKCYLRFTLVVKTTTPPNFWRTIYGRKSERVGK